MRTLMLSLLMLVGFVGCVASVDKTPSSIIEDLNELDLSDSATEALAIGATNGTSAFTYVGLGLFTVGAIMFATVMRDGGLKLIACGALAGAVPYVVQSAYFSIIVSGALLLALLIALYHLWWKVKQTENAEEEKKS
jgi:hypothetical protein